MILVCVPCPTFFYYQWKIIQACSLQGSLIRKRPRLIISIFFCLFICFFLNLCVFCLLLFLSFRFLSWICSVKKINPYPTTKRQSTTKTKLGPREPCSWSKLSDFYEVSSFHSWYDDLTKKIGPREPILAVKKQKQW